MEIQFYVPDNPEFWELGPPQAPPITLIQVLSKDCIYSRLCHGKYKIKQIQENQSMDIIPSKNFEGSSTQIKNVSKREMIQYLLLKLYVAFYLFSQLWYSSICYEWIFVEITQSSVVLRKACVFNQVSFLLVFQDNLE